MYQLSYLLSNQGNVIPLQESAVVCSSGLLCFQDEKP